RLEHLEGERLGVVSLHLRHACADRVAGKAAPDEDDEALEPRDAVAAVRERLDLELELLILLDGGGHGQAGYRAMEIRPCRKHEIESVLDLWRRADAASSVSDDATGVGGLLERDPDALLLAVEDDALLGTLIAGFDGWRGTLARLAVDPDHRRRGIATALLAAGEDRLRRL